jgi:hypothetical protein
LGVLKKGLEGPAFLRNYSKYYQNEKAKFRNAKTYFGRSA